MPQTTTVPTSERPREHHTTIDSTNRRALEWAADGAAHGAIVTADHQTAGRGRRGRDWQDEPGANLLCSVVLRPQIPAQRLGLIALAAGLAVSDVVDPLLPESRRCTIRWPNDVLVEGRKLAGILTESRLGSSSSIVVVGVGINVNQSFFPPDLATPATSLHLEAGEPIEREALLPPLLSSLDRYLDLITESPDAFIEAFIPRMHRFGEAITVTSAEEIIAGINRGIDREGALIVETAAGTRHLQSGEVSHRTG